MTVPALRFEGVDFRWDGRHRVLADVSFEIEKGDFASVIGPNGGGKTTLLKLALGLLEPNRGAIEVLGTEPIRARPRIGYMPQHATVDPRFPVRVLDVVLMGRLGPHRHVRRLQATDRFAALAALDRVGLQGLEERPFSALSGGQRQRVLLARAVVSDPELLLLDEPAAGLDQQVELNLGDLLQQLSKDRTIVLVSHDLGFVSSFVRTVVCVHQTVDVHPTSQLDGTAIHELYGGDVHLVHHEHRS